jgi:uncharacterized domain HDIG
LNTAIANLQKCVHRHKSFHHRERVAELAAIIAEKLNLGVKTQNDIVLAAYLHDIGKLKLDPNILNKPGKLTPEEYNHIKTHVLHSADYAIEHGFNAKIVGYIRHHHENYDGSGYPNSLQGNDIPIGARIIRVADFYDALTNDRVYRKKFSREEAIKVMKESASFLDPIVFEIFLSIN